MPDKTGKIVKQPLGHRIEAREAERLERMRNLALEDEQLAAPGAQAPPPAAQDEPVKAGKPLAVKSAKTVKPAAKGVGAKEVVAAGLKQAKVKTPQEPKKKDYSIKITATLEPGMVQLMDQECFARRLRKESPTYTDIIRTALEGFFQATGRMAK